MQGNLYDIFLSCLVLSCLVSSRLVSSRLVSSRLVSSRLVSSRRVASRLVASRLVSSLLVLSYLIAFYCPKNLFQQVGVEFAQTPHLPASPCRYISPLCMITTPVAFDTYMTMVITRVRRVHGTRCVLRCTTVFVQTNETIINS